MQEYQTVSKMVILLCDKWKFGTITICCLKGSWLGKKKKDGTRHRSNIQVSQKGSTSDNSDFPIFKMVFERNSVKTGLIRFW